MRKKWKTYSLYVAALGIFLFLYILFETVRLKNTGFQAKTLWDWMELLVVPLFLAGGALYLQRSERAVEREIAIDRQQEAALQSYLDRMAELLLKEKLRTSKNKEVRDVAKIRTFSVLFGLDERRKGF